MAALLFGPVAGLLSPFPVSTLWALWPPYSPQTLGASVTVLLPVTGTDIKHLRHNDAFVLPRGFPGMASPHAETKAASS